MILVAASTASELRGFRHPSVRVLVTGIGADAARRSLRRALADPRCDGLISTGFSGGLDPRLESGRIVVDAGRSDPGWANRFLTAFPSAANTRFASADRPVGTPAAKTALFSKTGCGVVDMESEAISELIAQTRIRALFVRVVLDDHSTEIRAPVMDWLGPDGNVRVGAALQWALGGRGRPGELARMAGMAARCTPVLRKALAAALGEDRSLGNTPLGT